MTNREELNLNISNQAKSLTLSKESQSALDNFMTNGLPHKKVEDYKYTNLDSFFHKSIKIDSPKSTLSKDLKDSIWIQINNGHLDLDSVNLPEGVTLEVKNKSIEQSQDFDSLENLNLVLTNKTIVIDIKTDTSVKMPIHISHTSDASSVDTIVSSRIEFNIGDNSSVRIIEQFNSTEEGLQNRNHLTILNASKNSNTEHVKVVTEGNSSFHFGSVQANVAENACLHSFTFTTGAKLSRNNVKVDLNGIGARGEVHGLYALRGEQHCDNFSQIHHRVERTESEQLFKAVLDDVSHGIFTGKIVVHRDAQLVNSSQLNKNLLLSKKAHADTRPQLEVYADDVKCAHGATVGQLSEEELFYLESRAISPTDAKVMLCHGFVQEALNKIKNVEIREYLEKLLFEEYEKGIHNRIREESL